MRLYLIEIDLFSPRVLRVGHPLFQAAIWLDIFVSIISQGRRFHWEANLCSKLRQTFAKGGGFVTDQTLTRHRFRSSGHEFVPTAE